jgi:coenzyme PQQ precursor peptide PqqA
LTAADRPPSFGSPSPVSGIAMQWRKPVIIEIALGCEINAYACAEVI